MQASAGARFPRGILNAVLRLRKLQTCREPGSKFAAPSGQLPFTVDRSRVHRPSKTVLGVLPQPRSTCLPRIRGAHCTHNPAFTCHAGANAWAGVMRSEHLFSQPHAPSESLRPTIRETAVGTRNAPLMRARRGFVFRSEVGSSACISDYRTRPMGVNPERRESTGNRGLFGRYFFSRRSTPCASSARERVLGRRARVLHATSVRTTDAWMDCGGKERMP